MNDKAEPRRGSAAPASASIRLSAIVPNFNHGPMIDQAIRAIADQVPPPDEIVVVDDGSTDNSLEILDRMRAHYPTLRIVSLANNQGAIGALNRGLQECHGKYVYLGAADDLTQPGLFAWMLEALECYPQAAFACCEALVVDSDGEESAYRPPVRPAHTMKFLPPSEVADILRHIDNWILPGASVIRQDLLLSVGGFDVNLGAFADGFALRQLALQHGCCFVPHVGLLWQISTRGLSRTLAADAQASLQTLEKAIQRIRSDAAFPDWYAGALERRWHFGISRIAVKARPMDRKTLLRVNNAGFVGRMVLIGASALSGPIGRFAAMVWLTLRYRPTSLIGLIRTSLARRRPSS